MKMGAQGWQSKLIVKILSFSTAVSLHFNIVCNGVEPAGRIRGVVVQNHLHSHVLAPQLMVAELIFGFLASYFSGNRADDSAFCCLVKNGLSLRGRGAPQMVHRADCRVNLHNGIKWCEKYMRFCDQRRGTAEEILPRMDLGANLA